MSVRDARNLKASPLLERTLLELRALWIDSLIDAPADDVIAAQAKVRALDEFAETLDDRIQRELDDAGEGPAE